MKTIELNRRQFLKGTGALIVSFNLFPPSAAFSRKRQSVPEAKRTQRRLTPGSQSLRTAPLPSLAAKLTLVRASRPRWRRSSQKSSMSRLNRSRWRAPTPRKRLIRASRPAAELSKEEGPN